MLSNDGANSDGHPCPGNYRPQQQLHDNIQGCLAQVIHNSGSYYSVNSQINSLVGLISNCDPFVRNTHVYAGGDENVIQDYG